MHVFTYLYLCKISWRSVDTIHVINVPVLCDTNLCYGCNIGGVLQRSLVQISLFTHFLFLCLFGWEQGYLWKKGHLRRNWSERWFTLKPSDLSYYVSEERKEKKGSISLDRNSCVEVIGHTLKQKEHDRQMQSSHEAAGDSVRLLLSPVAYRSVIPFTMQEYATVT